MPASPGIRAIEKLVAAESACATRTANRLQNDHRLLLGQGEDAIRMKFLQVLVETFLHAGKLTGVGC